MDIKKKCANCGKINSLNDYPVDEFYKAINMPTKSGAKEYFKLWHFMIEGCHYCNYSSLDIAKASNSEKKVINSKEYQNIFLNKSLAELQKVGNSDLPNQVAYAFLMEKTENYKEAGRAYLCASDFAYSQFIRWIIMEDDESEKLTANDKKTRVLVENYCKELFNRAIKNLKLAFKQNVNNETQILLIGALLSGEKEEVLQAKLLLDDLKTRDLTNEEKLIANYFDEVIAKQKA